VTGDAGRALKLVAGTVAAALVASFAPSATAHPPRSRVFYGSTSQGKWLSFRVSRGGRRVRGVIGAFRYTCTLGSSEVTRSARATIRSPLRVRAGGGFRYRGRVIVRSHGRTIGHGRVHFHARLEGSRTAAGRVKLTLKLSDGWSCKSGPVSFKAAARG
jgi:hypothetical protein